jgi:hypothetical protein
LEGEGIVIEKIIFVKQERISSDPTNGQWIHNALVLLNAKLFFPIATICKNQFICFFYNQLIDHVTIVKFVFKMLHPKEEESNDDDKEAEHVIGMMEKMTMK